MRDSGNSHSYQHLFREISTDPMNLARAWYNPQDHSRDLDLQILERLGEILASHLLSLARLTEFSAKTEDAVSKMLADRFTHLQVARKLNIDKEAVRHYQMRIKDLKILTMIVKGKTQTQIAAALGVTQETISKYCNHPNGLFARLKAVADSDPEIQRLRAEIREGHN